MSSDQVILSATFVAPAPLDDFLTRSIVGDAYEYDRDRETIHVVAMFPAPAGDWSLALTIHRDLDHGPLSSVTLQRDVTAVPKVEVVINAKALAPGRYAVRAVLLDGAEGEIDRAQWDFTMRSPAFSSRPNGCCHVEIPLVVETYPDASDTTWPISTAIPFPRGLVHDPAQLVLLQNGEPAAAQFKDHAYWSPLGSIQWLGLDFMARYGGGKPADYVLRVSPSATAQTSRPNVASDDGSSGSILLQTAAGRFRIDKQAFAGPIPDAPGISPAVAALHCGPYVVGEGQAIFEARHSPPEVIAIVENGPVKATVVVKGKYATASGGNWLCRYVTYITAFAESPTLRIAHRTIVTFDPHQVKIADVGWRLPTPLNGAARVGIDGSVHRRPAKAGQGIFVHQDRHDRCWLLSEAGGGIRRDGPMRRADGFVSVSGTGDYSDATLTLCLRDVYQKFPKELGVTWRSSGTELSLHFWPRHGHRAFSLTSNPPDPTNDELHRNNVYKLWYAHQGALLDLEMPAEYGDWLRDFVPAKGIENAIADSNAISNARNGKAVGVAIGNEFGLTLHGGSAPSDTELFSLARAFQTEPHAIADPDWSSRAGVEGSWAARDAARYPEVERAIDNGVQALANAIADCNGEYGMWIYADVHDVWLPSEGEPSGRGVPQLHRVWQASHYRNVWANWFLYLRSGLPALRLWARSTSDHYLHISTVHHVDAAIRGGKHVGDMYHCYATTPWGGESDVGHHYIDPDAHRLRGLLMSDQYATDMYHAWFAGLLGLDPAALQSTLQYGREGISTFGAVVSYYAFTQDANALLLLHRMAETIFDAYWDATLQQFRFGISPNPPDHPVWHRQCYQFYYQLTQDFRAVQFVTDWIAAGYGGIYQLSLRAFAYFATGNPAYLLAVLPQVRDHALLYHDALEDRYHGYGPAVAANSNSYFFQEVPYFLRALEIARLQFSDADITPITYPTRHGSDRDAATVYVYVPASEGYLGIRLEAIRHRGDPFLEGECVISRWSGGPLVPGWSPERTVQYPRGPGGVSISIPKTSTDELYRIGIFTNESEFVAPFTAFPEVIELRKLRDTGNEWLNSVRCWGRQSFWLDWNDPAYASVTLGMAGESDVAYYARPAFLRQQSAGGEVASGRTVFAFAQDRNRVPLLGRREFDVTLATPRPWHLFSVSEIGPTITLKAGPERVFLALQRDHLLQVVPRIPEE